ncbi:MAG: DbpA RNA binding domain-containing protein, partial [Aldersonia sp.]|nr:DbpA RNA binding domain-containing protein [Aldersonia sp.]
LKTIERVTKQKIPVEKVPTVADLRAKRLELTRAALESSLLEDNLDQFRVVIESLAGEYDVMDVALAAVKLAHEASGAAVDEEEIPEPAPRRDDAPKGPRKGPQRPSGRGMARIFIGRGRAAGIRPKDLVGAIAGESSLSGRDIGSIEIADRFSLVEVPDEAVDEVISALKRTTIKGKKATIKRDSGGNRKP